MKLGTDEIRATRLQGARALSGVTRALGALLISSCGPCDESESERRVVHLDLRFPNEPLRGATQRADVFFFPNTTSCEDVVGRIGSSGAVLGDALGDVLGEAVRLTLEPPFESPDVGAVVSHQPVALALGFDGTQADSNLLVEGCVEILGEARPKVWLHRVVPERGRILIVEGDRQAAVLGASTQFSPLVALVDARSPADPRLRHPLPGVVVSFASSSLRLDGRPPGVEVQVLTSTEGLAAVHVEVPRTEGEWTVVANVPALYEGLGSVDLEARERASRVTYRLAQLDPVGMGELLARPLPLGDGVPVAARVGDVRGGPELDVLVLTCLGSEGGCRAGRDAVSPLGKSGLVIVEDVVRPDRSTSHDLGAYGTAPADLWVGQLAPGIGGGRSREDVAILNSRRGECADRTCEGSELVLLTGPELSLGQRLLLTSSNAVALTSWKGSPDEDYSSLLVVSQGRSVNTRRCALYLDCSSYTRDTCETHPEECGCPPAERCECAGARCGIDETGVCVSEVRTIDVLMNLSNTGGAGFVDPVQCHLPELSCDKEGQNTRSWCRCLDNAAVECSYADSCGCLVPERLLIGTYGAARQIPKGVAAGVVPGDDGEQAFHIVVATDGGLDFFTDRRGLRWTERPYVISPVDGVGIGDFAGSSENSVVWYARNADTVSDEYANLGRTCPILESGSPIRGVAGLFIREPLDPNQERGSGPCFRYALDFRPDGFCHGDFDGDGAEDVALASSEASDVAVLYGSPFTRSLSFPPVRIELPAGARGGVLACAHLDGDTRTDIVVASASTGQLFVIPSQ
ncbi:MAG: VCBS repeat-containing protein [Deltaproteobacteria bacterium]|nr:VCBS repeat-containing protein [Deltaproteobacteria bacterium]